MSDNFLFYFSGVNIKNELYEKPKITFCFAMYYKCSFSKNTLCKARCFVYCMVKCRRYSLYEYFYCIFCSSRHYKPLCSGLSLHWHQKKPGAICFLEWSAQWHAAGKCSTGPSEKLCHRGVTRCWPDNPYLTEGSNARVPPSGHPTRVQKQDAARLNPTLVLERDAVLQSRTQQNE